jgi:hypothetical protein
VARVTPGFFVPFVGAFLIAPVYAVALDWSRQFGTPLNDFSWGVSADGLGNVYISGDTDGNLGGPTAGGSDAFVSKYDSAGNLLWSRQLGTGRDDHSEGVSADGMGNVYISGWTYGSLGGPNAGGDGISPDAFVAKYNAAGDFQWVRQLGTTGEDFGQGVSADALGNVYLAGFAEYGLTDPNSSNYNAFVAKYDAAGNLHWTRQVPSFDSHYNQGVSADGLGNVYLSGDNLGSPGYPYAGSAVAFVNKYDSNGTIQWTKQSADESSPRVSADRFGNVYLSGSTVTQYDSNGNLKWSVPLESNTRSEAVSADPLGYVYISGFSLVVNHDTAFVRKYDIAGHLIWTQQFPSSQSDEATGVAADALGNVYASGNFNGSIGGFESGGGDVFLAKYSDSESPPVGDYNRNGVVDAADYTVWRDHFALVVTPCTNGDGDCNGFVNYSDYQVWQDHFGESTDGGAAVPSTGSVAEPSSLLHVGVALVGMIAFRRAAKP